MVAAPTSWVPAKVPRSLHVPRVTHAPRPSSEEYYQIPAESSPFSYFFISVKRTTINLKVTALEAEVIPTDYEDHSSLLISEDNCTML